MAAAGQQLTPTVRPSPPQGAKWRQFVRRWSGGIFVLPALAVVLGVTVFPLLYSFAISFTNYYLPKPPPDFVGLESYARVLDDQFFRNSVGVTVSFALGSVTLEFMFGFALALLMNREFRGRGLFRTAFVLPMMVAFVVFGLQYKMLLQPNYGLYNYLLRLVFGPEMAGDWLVNPTLALPTVIVLNATHATPFMFLLLTAGLQSLPLEPYEAAKVDGASSIQSFFYLTLPLMRPVIFAAVLIRLVDSLKAFDLIFVTTAGGPGMSTEVMSNFIYKSAITFLRVGEGAAMSYLFLGVMLILLVLLFRSRRRAQP